MIDIEFRRLCLSKIKGQMGIKSSGNISSKIDIGTGFKADIKNRRMRIANKNLTPNEMGAVENF